MSVSSQESAFLSSLGLEEGLHESFLPIEIQNSQSVAKLLPKRQRNSHKGSYGKSAIVAGSVRYTGAAYLAAKASLKSGVGYTTLFLPDGLLEKYMLAIPEVLLESMDGGGMAEFNEEKFQKLLCFDSIAYGMGLGVSESIYQGARYLLKNYQGKLILDADALNSIAKYGALSDFFERSCEVLITPHLKEFSRLLGAEESIQKKAIEKEIIQKEEKTKEVLQKEIFKTPCASAVAFASKYKINLLLKGAATVLTDGKIAYVNVTGNSAQATGGTGDVLAGVIAGLCAQGVSVLGGGRLASYLVGKSAEFASKELSEYSATPSDFIDYLGKAFLSLSIPEDSNE